jgi:hypothetical protein
VSSTGLIINAQNFEPTRDTPQIADIVDRGELV